jgi:hypothetical protein
MGSILNFVFLKDMLEFNGETRPMANGPLFYYVTNRGYSCTISGKIRTGYKNLLLIESLGNKLDAVMDISDDIYDYVRNNDVKLLFVSVADPTDIITFHRGYSYIATKLPNDKYYIVDSNTYLSTISDIYTLDWFLEDGQCTPTNSVKNVNDLGYISEYIELNELKSFRNKKFLCFNRNVDRHHRISLLHEYMINNYSDSYFTFLLKTEHYSTPYLLDSTPYTKEEYNKLIPMELDTQNTENKHSFRVTDTNKKELFLNSCINLVTESSFHNNELFISEKIIKPIINYQPFIVFASVGYLKRLKTHGFKTFSDIWDENYDTIEDSEQRFFTLLKLVREINSKSIEEVNDIYKKCLDICIFNKNHFYSQNKDTMSDILKDISEKWDEHNQLI